MNHRTDRGIAAPSVWAARLCRFCTRLAMLFAMSAPAIADAQITSYAGSLDGLYANSHLIVVSGEALLVDAQLTRSDARGVVEMIERSAAKLKLIFITHAHPDHYLGLETLSRAFPRARIFSSQGTAIAIAGSGKAARRFWRERLGDDIAESVIVPDVIQATRLTLGDESIRLVDLSDGESKASAVLYLPARKWLFSGDLVFSGVHPWLVDNRARAWRQNLQRLRDLGAFAKIYPGHGETGDHGLLDRNTTYLKRFSEAARAAADADIMFGRVNELYPSYRLPHLLRLSAEAVMSARGRR